MKKVEASLKSLHDKLDKNVHNVKFVMEDDDCEIDLSNVINVWYAKHDDDSKFMIVDTGNPKSLTSKKWLDNYLKVNIMKKDDVKSRQCRQKFKFGPSKSYVSEEILTIPFTFQEKESGNM